MIDKRTTEEKVKEFVEICFYKSNGLYYPKFSSDCLIYNEKLMELFWEIL